jgi:hypothetical protein
VPRRSRRELLAAIDRALSPDRWVPALLEVQRPDGSVVLRAGGCWDSQLKRYVPRPVEARVVRLMRSQVEPDPVTGLSLADGVARWFERMRAGVDEGRSIIIMAAGNRGSGKTWFLGSLMALLVALEWPGGAQFSVNLSAKQRREVIQGIEKIADPRWLAEEVKDQRDPYLPFVTGHHLFWRTGRAPAALREGGITFHYGFINEGQDQHQDVALNAVGAIRNIGSLVGIATNPDPDGGWVGDLVEKIEAGAEGRGERYILRAELNDAINQAAQPKIAWALDAIDKDAADADARGLWRRRGAAYPAFAWRLRRVDGDGTFLDGHMGVPPLVGLGRWRDVTREETARILGAGAVGFDWLGGSDFQHDPGCCAAIAKLYRTEREELVLYIREFIGAPGDERSLMQALEDHEYFPGDVDFDGQPRPGRSLLLVGDGTGDIQDATHRRGNPYSFTQITARRLEGDPADAAPGLGQAVQPADPGLAEADEHRAARGVDGLRPELRRPGG